MPRRLFALAIAGLIAAAAPLPAQAQNMLIPGDTIVSMEVVRDIALDYGVDRIESIELNTFTGRWELEGTDFTDRDVDMEIDANTGAVIRVER
jgi:uncharacterized membrane protein YkoI